MLLVIVLTFLLLAVGFTRYMLTRDRGEREPVGALWMAFGLGACGLVLAGAIEYLLLPQTIDGTVALKSLASTSLVIAFIEEIVKSVPLIVYIYHKRYFNEHTDGVIYFALAGLGFGLPENVLYTFQFGSDTGMMRLLMTPFFHAATTALIGYAVIRLKLDGKPVYTLIATMAGVILIHALYDFGLFSQRPMLALLSFMITLALTGSVFTLLLRARWRDQLVGLSAVGNNSFCRTCGHPNLKRNLYCSQCGVRA
jgi:RsiW-degrading membrane proteinase PrsW (M82 family)